MRDKRYLRILGLFELALAIGAILTSISMIAGGGLFAEYPQEWIGKIPFESWSSIGILGLIVFGIGNFQFLILSIFQIASCIFIIYKNQ